MYYRGYYGSLRKKDGQFEGRIKDLYEDVSYSGATEEEAQEAFEKAVDKYIEVKKKHKRRVSITIAGIFAVLFFTLVLTCPNSSKHKEKFTEVVMATMADDEDNISALMLSKMFGMDISILGALVFTKDYFLFSEGYVRIDGKNVKVSFGIFGHVFIVVKPEQLTKLLDME